jgi:hypothetical protein
MCKPQDDQGDVLQALVVVAIRYRWLGPLIKSVKLKSDAPPGKSGRDSRHHPVSFDAAQRALIRLSLRNPVWIPETSSGSVPLRCHSRMVYAKACRTSGVSNLATVLSQEPIPSMNKALGPSLAAPTIPSIPASGPNLKASSLRTSISADVVSSSSGAQERVVSIVFARSTKQ